MAKCADQKPISTEVVRDVRRRLGSVRIAELAQSYRSGARTTELMRTYTLSKASVLALLEAEGVVMRRQSLTKQQVDEAARLYLQGLSLATTAKRLSLAQESIRRALIERGVVMRRRGLAGRTHHVGHPLASSAGGEQPACRERASDEQQGEQ